MIINSKVVNLYYVLEISHIKNTNIPFMRQVWRLERAIRDSELHED